MRSDPGTPSTGTPSAGTDENVVETVVVGLLYPPEWYGGPEAFAAAVAEIEAIDPRIEVVVERYDEPHELRSARGKPGAPDLRDRAPELTDAQRAAFERVDVAVVIDLPYDVGKLAPRLRWVQAVGAGTGQLQSAGIVEAGITLTSNAGSNSVSIGEFVIGRILQHWKRYPEIEAAQGRHEWNQTLYGRELTGSTLGLIGLGHINAVVANRAKAFGMEVLATRRSATPGATAPDVDEVLPTSELATMLGRADAVVAAVPETPGDDRVDGRGCVRGDATRRVLLQRRTRLARRRSRAHRRTAERPGRRRGPRRRQPRTASGRRPAVGRAEPLPLSPRVDVAGLAVPEPAPHVPREPRTLPRGRGAREPGRSRSRVLTAAGSDGSGTRMTVEPRSWRIAAAVPLAVQDWGGDGAPVLLAHPTGFHGTVWRPIATRLVAAGRHVFSFDFRGHGESDPSPSGYAWDVFAEDVHAVVDALGLAGEPALLPAGHSKGGAAFLLAEAAAPGTFPCIWAYEPIVIPGEPARLDEDDPLVRGARRRRDTWESRDAALAAFSSRPPLDVLDADALRAYVERGFRDVDRPAAAMRTVPASNSCASRTTKPRCTRCGPRTTRGACCPWCAARSTSCAATRPTR